MLSIKSFNCLQSVLELVHDRPLPTAVPAAFKGFHVDLTLRAMQLFPGSSETSTAAQSWLKEHSTEIKRVEDDRIKESQRIPHQLKGVMDMGFDYSLCHRALLICNGDANQAVNWLMDHGFQELENARNGVNSEIWGLEGVDFYQEKGHWLSESERQQEEKLRNNSGNLPLINDPYRRLCLSTSIQMRDQAVRNDKAKPFTAAGKMKKSCESAVNVSIRPDDLAPGVRVRMSRIAIKNPSLCSNLKDSPSFNQSRESGLFRWYFLTEDNHWAPLADRDTDKLEKCYATGISAVWIGLEDKSPNLVRLDKMCLFNELTGHGRPIKRKLVNRPSDVNITSISTVPRFVRPPEPPLPIDYYESFSASQRARCDEFLQLGFPVSWCAKALVETGFNLESAANWIFTHGQKLEEMDRENTKKVNEHKKWQEKCGQMEQKQAEEERAAKEIEERRRQRQLDEIRSGRFPWLKSRSELVSPTGPVAPIPSTSADVLNTPDSISYDQISQFSGCVGKVLTILPASLTESACVLVELSDSESVRRVVLWTPIDFLELDDTELLRSAPELLQRKFQGIAT